MAKPLLDDELLESDQTAVTAVQTSPDKISRPKTSGPSQGAYGHSVCAQERHSIGRFTPGDGVRLRHELLAVSQCMAAGRRMGQDPQGFAGSVASQRATRPIRRCRGQFPCSGGRGGEHTGPSPVDRRKNGTKHHLITDSEGVPFAVHLTGSNRHDVTQLISLVDAIGPIAGKVGRPTNRPQKVFADRVYDSDPHRAQLTQRGIDPIITERYTEHGSGLGIYRWVVERTISCLHQFRRLQIRYELRADIHMAFLKIGGIVICHRYLTSSFC